MRLITFFLLVILACLFVQPAHAGCRLFGRIFRGNSARAAACQPAQSFQTTGSFSACGVGFGPTMNYQPQTTFPASGHYRIAPAFSSGGCPGGVCPTR